MRPLPSQQTGLIAERDDLGAVGGIELLHGADAGGPDKSLIGSAFWGAAAL